MKACAMLTAAASDRDAASASASRASHGSGSLIAQLPPNAHNGESGEKYGSRFNGGFMEFLQQKELADVTVVGPDGTEYGLHMLLLAYHSEFFRRAFCHGFREKEYRRVELHCSDPCHVFPTLVDYFYTDEITLTGDNVMALLAMSRELMVTKVQDYCTEYSQTSLGSDNAIQYLSQAVQFNCDAFRERCLALVAEDFPSSYSKNTDGLPVDAICAVLQHSKLHVQTEEQVLVFVLNYVQRHELDGGAVAALFSHVNFPFLSNTSLGKLSAESVVPKDLLLAGMASRLQMIDRPERIMSQQGSGVCVPRKTYCCTVEYGLPGGSEYASLPLEAVWDELVPRLEVGVSGDMVEGDLSHVLRSNDEGAGFTLVGDEGVAAVWVEVAFPVAMRVTELSKYTFSHGVPFNVACMPYGISDSSWFQIKSLSTQVAVDEADTFTPLRTHETQLHTDFTVSVESSSQRTAAWRRMRICTSAASDGSPARLSIRNLKLFGRIEVSLTRGSLGKELLALWQKKQAGSSRARY